MARVAKPDTILAWYQNLIAQKFDGAKQRARRVKILVGSLGAPIAKQSHPVDTENSVQIENAGLNGCGGILRRTA
jgi:hypothetical protein